MGLYSPETLTLDGPSLKFRIVGHSEGVVVKGAGSPPKSWLRRFPETDPLPKLV